MNGKRAKGAELAAVTPTGRASLLSFGRAHCAQPRGTCLVGLQASAWVPVPERALLLNRDARLSLLCSYPSA